MRVTIIDDDAISIFLTEQVLATEGLTEVDSYESAEAALEFLLSCSETCIPDVLLLDLNMPVMNGWEFLDRLTPLSDRFREHCRIYILTSSLDLADTAKSQEYALVYGLIHKPIDSDDIKVVIAESSLIRQ